MKGHSKAHSRGDPPSISSIRQLDEFEAIKRNPPFADGNIEKCSGCLVFSQARTAGRLSVCINFNPTLLLTC